MNDDETHHQIVLYEYFGEYLSMLHNPTWRPGYARSFVVLDFGQFEDLGIPVKIAEEIIGYLPSHVQDMYEEFSDGEMAGGYVFLVSGKIDDHRKLFLEMMKELYPGPQGGDDDTYDYWPGAMETFEIYALQLYELTKDLRYLQALADTAHLCRHVDEWGEDHAPRLKQLYLDAKGAPKA